MQKENFSPLDSLKVIQSMIDKTKEGISDKSFYFLMWGWLTVTACLLQYYLLVVVKYEHHYQAWLLILLGIAASIIYGIKEKKKETVKTYASESMSALWTGIGLSFMGLSFILSRIGWQYSFPFYILLYGIGTFSSGSILKFKPLQAGGIACFVLAAAATYASYQNQILLTAAAVLVSYLIPGYLLKYRFEKK
ncbi:MAG: hypothetical protein ABJA37_03140 [Ferruginibacter sp.]